MKKYIVLILPLITIACAQFVPPTGGQRDITPPNLVNITPANKSLNIFPKKIEMEFDELIDISSLQQELLIIPTLKNGIKSKLKNNKVYIELREELDTNTTYTFNFRNGIKDLREKNPAKNLKFVFSTGSQIDSMSVTGYIIDQLTQQPVLDATVGLYRLDTINILKRKPTYFIKTDSTGAYSLENIKQDQYEVIAFTDKNNNLVYDQKNEKIGGLKETLLLNKKTNLDTIGIYTNLESKFKIKKQIKREKYNLIKFDKNPKSIEVINNPKNLTYKIEKDELYVYNYPNIDQDTTIFTVILKDSLSNIDTLNNEIRFIKPLKTSKNKQNSFNIRHENKSILSNIENILTFEYPIINIDTNKIYYIADTLHRENPIIKQINPYTISLNHETKATNDLLLFIDSESFTDINMDTNNVYKYNYKIFHQEDYGSIEGLTVEKSTKKIAQLLDPNYKVVNENSFVEKFEFKNILPGNYHIRIIFDTNDNNIWDPGEVLIHKLPEKVLITKLPIKLKSNFELKDLKIE